MFTGLIEDIGVIKSITNQQITLTTALDDIKRGDSVAVNGVCLTVTHLSGGQLSFDYSPQTDKLTNLSVLKTGDKVNLERALKLTSRLGGHFVSGHVDFTSKIISKEKQGDFFKFTFSLESGFSKYAADKGSVAVNGISLTIAEIAQNNFSVFIIPETVKNTTLNFAVPNDLVNIETDILSKYVERLLGKEEKKDLSIDFLKENGFA